jgi:Bacterial Ig-like domain (group 3)
MWRLLADAWRMSGLFRLAVFVIVAMLIFRILAPSISWPTIWDSNPIEVAVKASTNPAEFGRKVTITAHIQHRRDGSSPSAGWVTFFNGSEPIGERPLLGGSASIETADLPLGTYQITALFRPETGGSTGTNRPLVLTIVSPYLGQVGSGRTKPPRPPDSPTEPREPKEPDASGPPPSVGSLVGVWGRAGGSSREPYSEHPVEFRDDGSARITWNRRKIDELTYTYHPGKRKDEGTLSFYKPNRRTRQDDFLERGQVRWLDAYHFMYIVEQTSNSIRMEGWEYSYVHK